MNNKKDCQVSRRASPVGPSLAQTRYDELPGALRPRGMRSKRALDSLRNTLASLGKYFEVSSDYSVYYSVEYKYYGIEYSLKYSTNL